MQMYCVACAFVLSREALPPPMLALALPRLRLPRGGARPRSREGAAARAAKPASGRTAAPRLGAAFVTLVDTAIVTRCASLRHVRAVGIAFGFLIHKQRWRNREIARQSPSPGRPQSRRRAGRARAPVSR